MKETAYEQCLDLMSFYEVYCRQDGSVIKGDIGGVITIAATLATAIIVAKIW